MVAARGSSVSTYAARSSSVLSKPGSSTSHSSGTSAATSSSSSRVTRGASSAAAAATSGEKGARAWSEASYGFAAEAWAPRQLWCQIMVAPWSISHRSPCQTSMFGLRQDRSTLLITASSQTTFPASFGSTSYASGSKPSEPGR